MKKSKVIAASLLSLVIGWLAGCREELKDPEVRTDSIGWINHNTAQIYGNLADLHGSHLIQKMIVWGKDPSPTVAENSLRIGGSFEDEGPFFGAIGGLEPNTAYYVRTYALSGDGESYGNELTFTTRIPETIQDERDGKEYVTVKIGDQEWMADNLAYASPNSTSYDGVELPGQTTDPKIYGRLYSWDEAISSRAAGWHVPSDEEWMQLERELNMDENLLNETLFRGTSEARAIKEAGRMHWKEGNSDSVTNETGLTLLPGGSFTEEEGFLQIEGTAGMYWSSTISEDSTAWMRGFQSNRDGIMRNASPRNWKLSVRCIKN